MTGAAAGGRGRDLAALAERLRELHVPGRPLILPNAWDVASARAVESAGFAAIATSSAAVAEALGYGDGEQAPAEAMFAAAARVAAAVGVPVTLDAEAGYGLTAAAFVSRLVASGAVGCNVEDSDHRAGGVRDAAEQAAWLGEVRTAATAAGVPFVINARVDVHIREIGPPETRTAEAIRRGNRYLEAGADCVYPIWVADEPTIAALVAGIHGPVNIYARPEAPSPTRLAELGVARVSFGPWIHRLAMREVARLAAAIAAGADVFAA
ncbi:MAG TPA: isocitrate lyase/phosphoenolpyruvate mutase family protein [Candidatus Sulfotelmatobacter sp.]|nr:isocitrate lyase/phosphoenolpyruvate mutase family protein [Candidatus Sulfotelmatobacter sp.]